MMNMTPEQQAQFDAMTPAEQENVRQCAAMSEQLQGNPRTRAKLERAMQLMEELWEACEPLQPTPDALVLLVTSEWASWHEKNVGKLVDHR